jgi:DinB family protein
MAIANPYERDLGGRVALEALADTPERIRQLVERWRDDQFERSYEPGKWTARQVLVHLAQIELALGTRSRFALTQAGYTAQPFSQDDWMALEGILDAGTALAAYVSMRRMNLAMWRTLTPERLDRPFAHPEYGEITVAWTMAMMAGHDIRHLQQLKTIPA